MATYVLLSNILLCVLSRLMQPEQGGVTGTHLVALLQYRVAPAGMLPASPPEVVCDVSRMSNGRRFAAPHLTESTTLHACADDQSLPLIKEEQMLRQFQGYLFWETAMPKPLRLVCSDHETCTLLTHFRDLPFLLLVLSTGPWFEVASTTVTSRPESVLPP